MRNFTRKKKAPSEGGQQKKYGNKKVEFMGIKFDSIRERDRYIILLDAQKRGIISDLELQPKYELVPAVITNEVIHLKTKDKIVQKVAQKAITYIGDFRYTLDGNTVVEDVKGSKFTETQVFKLKAKMMYAIIGIKVKTVYKPNESI